MLALAEGEGLEDGGGRTPTRDATELRPLARTAARCPQPQWAGLLCPALLVEPPRGGMGPG